MHEPDASLTLLGRATANVLHGRRWLLLELLLCDKGVKRDYGRQGLILLCLHHGLMRELQKGGLQQGTLLRLSARKLSELARGINNGTFDALHEDAANFSGAVASPPSVAPSEAPLKRKNEAGWSDVTKSRVRPSVARPSSLAR